MTKDQKNREPSKTRLVIGLTLYIVPNGAPSCRNVPRGGSSWINRWVWLKIIFWLGNVFLIETFLSRCDKNENVWILDLWHSEGDHKMNHSSYWSRMTIMKWSTVGVATDHFGLGMIDAYWNLCSKLQNSKHRSRGLRNAKIHRLGSGVGYARWGTNLFATPEIGTLLAMSYLGFDSFDLDLSFFDITPFDAWIL